MVNSDDHDKFCTHMSSESALVLLTVADHMGYDVGVRDIRTAYLNANAKENVWTRADQSFVKNGYALKTGIVIKAQYGLPSSGHEWWLMLADTLRDMGFTRSRGDPDVWLRPNG